MSIIQDTVIMPDKYSTGVRPNIVLTNISDIEGVTIDTTNKRFMFTRVNIETLKNKGFAEIIDDNRVRTLRIQKILFYELYLQMAAPYLYADQDVIEFVDCKIDGGSQFRSSTLVRGGTRTEDTSTKNNSMWNTESLIFKYCDFSGYKCNTIMYANMPVIFDHCKAYEMGSDCFNTDNPYSKILDCYGYNCGLVNTFNGDSNDAHADFIQGQGAMDSLFPDELGKSKITIRRCRSDIFQYLNSDNGKYYMSNAALYLDTDKGSMSIDADYMWAVAGAYTYRAERSKEGTFVTGNATNLYSGTNWFGNKHINSDFVDCHYEVSDISNILVGSIWVEGEAINISVTNYDTINSRKFKIKTNQGISEEYAIFNCPSATELCVNANGTYTFKDAKSWNNDFPIDKIYTIPSDAVKWVQIYDTTDGNEVLVRTEILSGESSIDEGGNIMTTSIIEINGNPARSDIKRFMLLTVDEISKLPKQGVRGTLDNTKEPDINCPCGIGSEAIVKTGEIYMLWPNNEWAPF